MSKRLIRQFRHLFVGSLALLLFVAGCNMNALTGSRQVDTLPTVTPGKLTIVNVMANEVPAVVVNGAVYLTVLNGTAQTVHLVAAQSDLAEQVTFHETINDDGVVRMIQPDGGFEIGAGESLVLAPGGKHLMLEHLKSPLHAGESFTLTLTFDNAETRVLPVPIMPIGSTEPEMDTMDHGTMQMAEPTAAEHDHTGN